MAFEQAFESPSGVSLPTAYYRLVVVHNDYDRKEAVLGVFVYQNDAARRMGRSFFHQCSYQIKNYPAEDTKPARMEYDAFMAGEATLTERARGYRHLKTRAEYATAVDLL